MDEKYENTPEGNQPTMIKPKVKTSDIRNSTVTLGEDLTSNQQENLRERLFHKELERIVLSPSFVGESSTQLRNSEENTRHKYGQKEKIHDQRAKSP